MFLCMYVCTYVCMYVRTYIAEGQSRRLKSAICNLGEKIADRKVWKFFEHCPTEICFLFVVFFFFFFFFAESVKCARGTGMQCTLFNKG